MLADLITAGCDAIVIGGDHTWGPLVREVVAALEAQPLPLHIVGGNCERDTVAAQDPIDRFCAERLAERRDWLVDLPLSLSLAVDGLGDVCFCHATPADVDAILTCATPAADVAAALGTASIVVAGHTHVAFDRKVGAQRLINPGSVGLAYEGEPGVARWAALGPAVELRSSRFDVADACARLTASGMPDVDTWLEPIRSPPTAEEATAAFEARRLS